MIYVFIDFALYIRSKLKIILKNFPCSINLMHNEKKLSKKCIFGMTNLESREYTDTFSAII